MSDVGKSGWDKILEQVTNPWDWAFGIAGGATGVGISVATAGTDLGTSITLGFTIGIAARKALVASLQRKRLKRRAMALKNVLQNLRPHLPALEILVEGLNLDFSLWENRATSSDDFAKQMDILIDKLRVVVSNQTQSIRSLPPSN